MGRMWVAVGLVLLCALALGCGSGPGLDAAPACDIAGDPLLEVGIPSQTGLRFAPLVEGGDISVGYLFDETGGGGWFIFLAFQAQNVADTGVVELTVEYFPSPGERRMLASEFQYELRCRSTGLEAAPIGLVTDTTGPDEFDGRPADVTITFTDVDGRTASATANGVLRCVFGGC